MSVIATEALRNAETAATYAVSGMSPKDRDRLAVVAVLLGERLSRMDDAERLRLLEAVKVHAPDVHLSLIAVREEGRQVARGAV